MLAHSIAHAKQSRYITRVMVSTDSEQYAAIAKEYGAEVPFLRPAEYATDQALDYDVFRHALGYLRDTEQYEPELVVQLRPTYPIRDVADIDAMIEQMQNTPQADAIRTIAPAKEIPYKMWKKAQDGVIVPLMTDIEECYNMPRQELPKVYYQNACIDIFRPRCIWQYASMTGKTILGYEMKQNYDIDTEEEFQRASRYLKMMQGGQRFVFDIDGVIAQFNPDLDYANALPNERMVSVIRKLYEAGNEIILHTARGYVTGVDWRETTEQQLKRFGLPYHELHFGKPNADYYVDDKMLDMNDLLELFGQSEE
jgi:CMP-N-acetylneuraminic acid synthetase